MPLRLQCPARGHLVLVNRAKSAEPLIMVAKRRIFSRIFISGSNSLYLVCSKNFPNTQQLYLDPYCCVHSGKGFWEEKGSVQGHKGSPLQGWAKRPGL